MRMLLDNLIQNLALCWQHWESGFWLQLDTLLHEERKAM